MGDKKLCEQVCEPLADSYVCKCNKGYVLNDDNITCRRYVETPAYDSEEDENDDMR